MKGREGQGGGEGEDEWEYIMLATDTLDFNNQKTYQTLICKMSW